MCSFTLVPMLYFVCPMYDKPQSQSSLYTRNLRGTERKRTEAGGFSGEGLFVMHSFFQKPSQRKRKWISPDGSMRNEIDFIISDKRRIFKDVSVSHRVKNGSDHRIVRGTLNINVKLERPRLIKSTLRPTCAQIENLSSRVFKSL
nr:craniofacial development protein 2-like [Danaus plexippus plexippus]